MKTYPIHPIAKCYPPLSNSEFEKLKLHIKDNGLLNPIVLFEEQILDGVHRERACRELGIEPQYCSPQITDPYAYVIGQNERRRKLSKTQLGLVAERIANLKNGSNQFQKQAEKSGCPILGDIGVPTADVSEQQSFTKAYISKQMKIGHSTIDRIRFAKNHAVPAIIKALEEGKITAARAHHLAHLPKEKQMIALKEVLKDRKKKMPKTELTGKTKEWRDFMTEPAPLHKRCERLWHTLLSLHFNSFKTKEDRKAAAQYIIAACTKVVELIDEVDTLEELYTRTH